MAKKKASKPQAPKAKAKGKKGAKLPPKIAAPFKPGGVKKSGAVVTDPHKGKSKKKGAPITSGANAKVGKL